MSKKEIADEYGNETHSWVLACISCVVVIVAGTIIVALLNGNGEVATAGNVAGIITILGIISMFVSVIGLIKIRGRRKIVPILSLILLTLLTGATYFTYWFSKYPL